MYLADTALRSILRAAAWRCVRALPVWVSFSILTAGIVFGGHV